MYSFFVWYHFLLCLSLHFFLWQTPTNEYKSVIMGSIDLIFLYENVIVFIFKKMKTLKNCIQFLYSNPFFFFFFFDTKNENWIQIQSQTRFLVVSLTKNWKWIQNTPLFCSNHFKIPLPKSPKELATNKKTYKSNTQIAMNHQFLPKPCIIASL